jgi:hypothetical protein
MSIDVKGHLYAGVPHLIADVFGTFTLCNEHGCKEVTQIMKSDFGQASFASDSVKQFVEVIRVNVLAGTVDEEQYRGFGARSPPDVD